MNTWLLYLEAHSRKKENNNDRFQERRKKEKSALVIGAWNVRTLLDRSSSDRADMRTALVGKELSRYNIDIAACDSSAKHALLMRDSSRKLAIDTLSSSSCCSSLQYREHMGFHKEFPWMGVQGR